MSWFKVNTERPACLLVTFLGIKEPFLPAVLNLAVELNQVKVGDESGWGFSEACLGETNSPGSWLVIWRPFSDWPLVNASIITWS